MQNVDPTCYKLLSSDLGYDLAVENSSSISSEAELGMGTTLLSISDFEKRTNSEERGL